MPDIFGASGQFSIDSLGQQNQNALNNAYGSGGFGGTVGQYAPYPMFGGPINTGPAPSVFSQGAAPVPQQDLTARYYELMGQTNRGQPQTPWYPQQAPSATFDQRFPQSQAPPATFDQRFPQSSAPATFDQRFPQSQAPPATFDQRFPASSAQAPQQDLTARYYQLMGYGGGGGGGAQQASMSMNPYLSMGGRPDMAAPNIDPHFEKSPESIFGYPGANDIFTYPGTQDYNIINPNSRPNLFFDPAMNNRNNITNALLNQQQVAQGAS